MKKKNVFEVNDIVRYTSKFLQCTGQVTGAPKNGRVVGFSDIKDDKGRPFPRVWWCDREESDVVHPGNIQLVERGRPQYAGS